MAWSVLCDPRWTAGRGSAAFGEIRVLGMAFEKGPHEWAMYDHPKAVSARVLESRLGERAGVPAAAERGWHLGVHEGDVPLPFVIRQHSDGSAVVDLEALLLRIL